MTTRSALVFDGPNILMRAIKAAEARVDLSSDEGVRTAPVFMAINMAAKYIRRYPAEAVVFTWDKGHDHRDAIYAGYKQRRAPHNPEVDDIKTGAFGMLKEFLSLAGIHHVELPGFEADDIIAAYWQKPWLGLTIVSGDKDLLQLVAPNVRQVRPGGPKATAQDEEWDVARVTEQMLCKPDKIPYVMALTGDSGDDVPGIPGYGIKTAVKHLDAANWDFDTLLKFPPDRLAKVEGFESVARRNLALVDLRYNPPLRHVEDPPRFEPTTINSPAWFDLMNWLDEYGIETVKNRLTKGTLWREDGQG